MSRYQVTQELWWAVAQLPKVKLDLPPEPAHFEGDKLPVEQVNWEDAVEFCQRLERQFKRAYRLPSEAEWEYACRAGSTTPFAFGPTITPELINYDGNYPYGKAAKGEYRQQTVPVGSLGIANAFGLYDMHGNVWEWCADVWHDSYKNAPIDGSAWLSDGDSSLRVLRGRGVGRRWKRLPRRRSLLGRPGRVRRYRFACCSVREDSPLSTRGLVRTPQEF